MRKVEGRVEGQSERAVAAEAVVAQHRAAPSACRALVPKAVHTATAEPQAAAAAAAAVAAARMIAISAAAVVAGNA